MFSNNGAGIIAAGSFLLRMRYKKTANMPQKKRQPSWLSLCLFS